MGEPEKTESMYRYCAKPLGKFVPEPVCYCDEVCAANYAALWQKKKPQDNVPGAKQ